MASGTSNMTSETSNMGSEPTDRRFSLKSSKITISSVIYTLKVPNFFILPEYDTDFHVKSPTFEFANATWQLKFLRVTYEPKDDRSFEVYLLKMNSGNEKQAIICTIDLLDAYDDIYDSCRNAFILDEDDDDELYIDCFRNGKTYCDRRETLTLVIQLISDRSFKVPPLTETDVEILSQDFKKLLLNGKNQDLTLRVADKEFRVHQDILMSRSPVFEAMLTHGMTEKDKGVLDVPDCNPQAMEQLLLYVYSGNVETLNQDNVFALHYAAEKYQMLPLKEKCTAFIKQSLSPSIICKVIQLALDHSNSDLLECATEYFVNHINEILPTVEWMSFMKTNMIAANALFIKATNKWSCAKS